MASSNLAKSGRGRKDRRRHLEALLDAALEATFPASDPLAIATPHAFEETTEPTPTDPTGKTAG